MTIEELLVQMGINISSNLVYDFVKGIFPETKEVSGVELKKQLASFLSIKDAEIKAEKIINFMAEKGDIEIKGSMIFAKNSIFYSSTPNSKFSLEESSSETEKTRIDVGKDAKIEGQGGAGVSQNEDGSISFYT